MKDHQFSRRALTCSAAAAMLAGCGGSQPPIAAPGAMPQTPAIATLADRGKSWMLPEAKSEDLLYASDVHNNVVDVYSFPRGKYVGMLTGFGQPYGLCVDAAGDIFVPDFVNSRIVEYGHGEETPKATLDDAGYSPLDCSVDPKTGNLAVTNNVAAGKGQGSILIYVGAKGTPQTYVDPKTYYYFYCTYDDNGNLYFDGGAESGNSSDNTSHYELLQVHRNRFRPIGIHWNPRDPKPQAGGLHWFRGHLAIAKLNHDTSSSLYEVDPRSGRILESAPLSDSVGVEDFFIRGSTIVSPNYDAIQFWRYPSGGSPTKTIPGDKAIFVSGALSKAR
jgi:hypothetical protein